MKELDKKDLRWHIAFEITNGDLDDKTSGEIADRILSLLPVYGSQPNKWGLAAEKRCSFCQETGKMFGNVRVDIVSGLYQSIPCHRCKGAGTITRILTNDEVGELVRDMIPAKVSISADFDGGARLKNLVVTLPSGERVILLPEKEKK